VGDFHFAANFASLNEKVRGPKAPPFSG
jgi:hypothetical protein